MMTIVFVVLALVLYFVWKLKWSIIERFLFTVTIILLCFTVIKRTNLLIALLNDIKIFAIVIIVFGLIIYIGKKFKDNPYSEQDINQLQLQAQQSENISKLKKKSVSTIKNIILGVFAFLFMLGLLVSDSDSYNPKNDQQQYVNGYMNKTACWVADINDIYYLADAVSRNDMDYLNTLILKGKVHVVDKKTQIEIRSLYDENMVTIFFLEGKYAGSWGYTIKGFVHKN